MPKDWKKYKLGEIAEIIMGQSPISETCNANGDGTPLLNGPTEFTSHYPVPVQFTTDAKKISEFDDILFCVRGSTTGRMNWSDRKYAIGRGLAAIRHKKGKEYNFFLKGLIDSNLKNILGITTGSTFPNISGDQLREFDVMLPDLKTQQSIASILSSIDNKMELNLQMNQTLEEIAQTIFKEWFVNFNFSGANGKLVNGLPKGWRMGKLSEVLEIKYGKDYKHLAEGDIPLYGSGGVMKYVDRAIYNEESILIPRKGTLSNLFYTDKPFWSVDTMFYSIIKGEAMGKYLFYLLKTLDLASMNVGSAVPSLTTQVLNNLSIKIPSITVLAEFEKIITSFYQKTESNRIENEILIETRNSVLPQLMTGQIEIKA